MLARRPAENWILGVSVLAIACALPMIISACGPVPHSVRITSSRDSTAQVPSEQPSDSTAAPEAPSQQTQPSDDNLWAVEPGAVPTLGPDQLPPLEPTANDDGPGQPDPDTHGYLTPYAQKAKAQHLRGHQWGAEWDSYVFNALTPRMLSNEVPGDVKVACPRFFQLTTEQMKQFWAYFFQSIAVPESDGLNPNSYFKEGGTDPVTKQVNYSQGLLQLSYGDALSGCAFDWSKDKALVTVNANHTLKGLGNPKLTINDPRNNLECGVKIMNRQLFDDRPGNSAPHSLFTHGRSYYWSTLRVRDPKQHPNPNGYDTIMQQLKYGVPSFCGKLP